MKINFTIDKNYLPKKIRIIPDEHENTDTLHEMSRHLYIANPVLEFSDNAKKGEYDKLSDPEYERILSMMKRLNRLFIKKGNEKSLPAMNVFDLLVALLYKYM